jgi:deazaflavin-dependent oxidoreductase (nitroreductase family)
LRFSFERATIGCMNTRSLIAVMQMTRDGFIQDPEGRSDWVDSWADGLELLPAVDAFVLGGGMFPEYERFWTMILDDPAAAAELLGRAPYDREIAYARRAAEIPHLVLSRTLDGTSWPSARIVRELDELVAFAQQPGKPVYVVGGPTLVGGLIDAGLLDELRMIVHPVAVGAGRAFELPGSRATLAYRLPRTPLLLLRTIGARTGEAHTTPLAYREDGDRLYVIASNGGATDHPAWYRNLRADPRVSVELGGKRFEASATVLDGAERDGVFARIAEESPAARTYQASTARTIPVIALDRRLPGLAPNPA